MKQIDMTPYQPYKKPATCQLREIGEKKIVWPFIDYVDPENPDFRLRVMARNDIHTVAELMRSAYADVYGSIHEWILHPEEYEGRSALADQWETHATAMPNAVIVGEEISSGKIVMASIYTKWDRNLQVEASFFAIHPDFRKSRVSSAIWSNLASLYKWLEDSGAEYVTVFCETWQNITQYIWFKRLGWKIAGIFPGNFTRWAGGNSEYRGCTVHFYRFLNNGANYATQPEEWDLLPEIKELWDYLEKINTQN